MNSRQILSLPSMPAISPSYPRGPYRFIDREYFIITYESDPDALAQIVPEPLLLDDKNLVNFEWIRMPDSQGLGSYMESGCTVPCHFKGEPCNYVVQMYLDNESPISAGREIWGFPKKFGLPKLEVVGDTLTGTLDYAGQRVATGTMGYKHCDLCGSIESILAALTKTQVNLKLIPGVDGNLVIAQLVAYNLMDIVFKGAWSGPARLHLIPHANAPVADLPVKKTLEGRHIIADLTLPYARVLHDYLS